MKGQEPYSSLTKTQVLQTARNIHQYVAKNMKFEPNAILTVWILEDHSCTAGGHFNRHTPI